VAIACAMAAGCWLLRKGRVPRGECPVADAMSVWLESWSGVGSGLVVTRTVPRHLMERRCNSAMASEV